MLSENFPSQLLRFDLRVQLRLSGGSPDGQDGWILHITRVLREYNLQEQVLDSRPGNWGEFVLISTLWMGQGGWWLAA
jgi:hypothetical protein